MEPTTMLALGLGGFAVWKLSRAMMGKIPAKEARALVERGARLLDVRTPREHAARHIEGSTNVPVQELASRLAELGDKGTPIVVYCASGIRSATAARMLRRAGFTDVHDLGGIARWR